MVKKCSKIHTKKMYTRKKSDSTSHGIISWRCNIIFVLMLCLPPKQKTITGIVSICMRAHIHNVMSQCLYTYTCVCMCLSLLRSAESYMKIIIILLVRHMGLCKGVLSLFVKYLKINIRCELLSCC